ncbi:MAG TPA: DUF4159 domain-containing protein [Anaerolineae bacterium]|nr:DUF4159 domain-containing protein [Anaerolineae bacterium]
MTDLLHELPIKRIKPADGMAVTAQVWEEAHEYHRQWQRSHDLYAHGARIVTGLEVIASDPPDSSLYVLPGIALDPLGQTIVVPEPVAYDVGQAQGQLYLLLTYEESPPTAGGEGEDGPLYIYGRFGLQAMPALDGAPSVELARVRRQSRQSVLLNARDAVHPGPNEIDLRFRPEVVRPGQKMISVAVSYVGRSIGEKHSQGVDHLARALRHAGGRVCVDNLVLLAPGLEAYTLLYLVGNGEFQLSRDEMNALYAYVHGGGTLFFESCRRGVKGGEPPADGCFFDVLASMGMQVEAVPAGHRLLVDPHLFGAPPPGFETEGAPRVQIGDGIIVSQNDYGCLWQGERRGRPATREEIRSAIEWGENIVAYALGRLK